MEIKLYKDDLPANLDLGKLVAVDCEMMGLNPIRDRLCLVQLSSGNGVAHLVQLRQDKYDAPNLKKLLTDKEITKIFHFGRSDIASIWVYLNVLTAPVYCTKVASRLARTFTGYHSLKNLCNDLLEVDISKQQQTSDWGAPTLTEKQLQYAASDVQHLHQLKEKLDAMLVREGRMEIAQACFNFLPTRALLDVAGWQEEDIFEH